MAERQGEHRSNPALIGSRQLPWTAECASPAWLGRLLSLACVNYRIPRLLEATGTLVRLLPALSGRPAGTRI